MGVAILTCMPGKDVKVDATLSIEGGYKLPSGSNKTEHFNYKGEWANA